MRTISSDINTVLTGTSRSTRYRLWVDSTGAGVYVDLTAFSGKDWLGDITWGDDLDSPVQTANFHVLRAVHDLSLNPLMGSSKLNNGVTVLDYGRRLYLETATVPYNAPAQSADWVRAWEGYVDDIDIHDTTLELVCRDLGSVLVDTYIESQRTYAGASLVSIMQSIIQDNIIATGIAAAIDVNLYYPVTPSFSVIQYIQEKMSVWDALLKLASLIGWDLRYRWDSGTSRFRLTLTEPDRAGVTVLRTFGPDDYYEVPTAKISRQDIRNAVQCVFTNASTGLREKVIVTDTTSITRAKRRFMEISEGTANQIDSNPEATALVTAALADLSTPKMDHAYLMDYFFAAEVGDYYTFSKNGAHYDVDQSAGVVSVKHSISADSGEATTVLGVRGKPASGVRRWLRIEGRPGVAPNADYIDPYAPSGVAISSTLAAIQLTFTPPDPSNWASTEVYMARAGVAVTGTDISGNITDPGINAAGKNQRPEPTLLVASGRSNRFTINSLAPGYTYNARLLTVDNDGNVSALSAQFQVQTEQVGPYHTNPDGVQALAVPNSDFNIYTQGRNQPPDYWCTTGLRSAFWGTNKLVWWSVDAGSGKFCLVFFTGTIGTYGASSGDGGIATGDSVDPDTVGYIPFSESDILALSVWARWGTLPTGYASLTAVATLVFYDVNHNVVPFTSIMATETTTGAADDQEWALRFRVDGNVPASTRYVRVFIERDGWQRLISDPNTIGEGLYVDRVSITRGLPRAFCNDIQANEEPANIAAGSDHSVPTFDDLDVVAIGIKTPESGDDWSEWVNLTVSCNVDVTFTCLLEFGTDGQRVDFWIDMWDPDTAAWSIQNRVSFTGDDNEQRAVGVTAASITFKRGAKIRIMVYATPGSDIVLQPDNSVFTIQATQRFDR